MQQTAPMTPIPFFDAITAYQRSAALKSAIELDLFTHIGRGSDTAAAMAPAAGASERGVRILCDSLTVMGFLMKENGRYRLNEMSAAFLDANSPTYVGGAADFLMSEAQMRGFQDLTNTVRRGGAAPEGNASMAADSEMWVKFARGMMPFIYPMAEMTAAHIGFPPDAELKVLDVAAGHGIFGILTASKFPNAVVYGADWPNVLEVAKENAERFGVAGRYHTIEGDAFDTDFGTGYDVILVPNFLHHFDAERCTEFLRKCNSALKDNGKVITVEFVPNDDRVSPPMEAMFALVMLAGTPSGDAYTFSELKKMCDDAGFARNEHVPLDPMPSHLVISMK
jgi:2-polyprenyl-3-methyl-5-hydroxy-6-metoxy-1,4-benzoquinol methylase